MAYLGKSPSQGVRNRYYFTASGGETSISGAITGGTLTFSDGNYVDVTLNGVTLVAGTDYNTSTANTIAGLTALTASDVVEIVVYDTFSVFSGNVNSDFSVGGDLTVTGTTTITGLTTTGDITFGDNDKAVFGAGSDLEIYHDGHSYIKDVGSGDLVIQASDDLLLESTSGENYINCNNNGSVEVFYDGGKKFETTSTGVDVTGSGDRADVTLTSGARNKFVGSAANDLQLGTYSSSNTSRDVHMTITSDGFVGISNTTPSSFFAGARNLVVGSGSGNNGMTIYSGTSNTGNIKFADGTGSDAAKTAGGIRYDHSGGYMRFDTNDGSERLRITSDGAVGIGTSTIPTTDSMLTVRKDGSANEFNILSGTSHASVINMGDADDYNIQRIKADNSSNSLQFQTNNAERMRINSSGNLLVGTTTQNGTDGITLRGSGTDPEVMLNKTFSGNINGVRCQHNSTYVGGITYNNTSTAFNTSSDARLKENITYDWDATTRLKQLKPARFNFIADADTTVDGFLAHEAQAVVPESVTGTKDEVDDDGNPVYQGIDQAKLVPLLVKTIQELEARITALEAE